MTWCASATKLAASPHRPKPELAVPPTNPTRTTLPKQGWERLIAHQQWLRFSIPSERCCTNPCISFQQEAGLNATSPEE
jgi:hypothetical protein